MSPDIYQPMKPYAIITGASGGLGTCFSLECARLGYNLLLIGLPNENIKGLSDYLQRNFDIEAIGMELDISDPGAGITIRQFVESRQLPVSMLINNAGLGQNELFENCSLNYLQTLIGVNCTGMVLLTNALLPVLRLQPRSNIICVSSLGSFYILPRKSCYNATKGFIRMFCQALRMELAASNIKVSILCPGPMTTNLANYQLHKQLNWFSQKMLLPPSRAAQYALSCALKGQEIIIPGRLNRTMKVVAGLIPEFIQKKLSANSMKQLGN